MEIGVVKWVDNAKGFGFISHEGTPDIFMPRSSLEEEGNETLKKGDKVAFEILNISKGPMATKVVKI